MIKKISIEQLRVGMYVHDINCGWLDHPFLLNKFFVPDEATLARIVRTGTREVYIDTALGDDLPREQPPTAGRDDAARSKDEVDRELLAELRRLAGARARARARVPARGCPPAKSFFTHAPRRTRPSAW
ncbi:MAG: DUF3391 domain-containing protein [Gammaproteobacteria bacterium]|nr:DUF3391 domain-containing protein [Gammaproteobacteria bacterium]